MLDHFTVFTKGGIVLFSSQDERPLVGNPISELIASVLLEDRTGERSWTEGPYVVKWTFANDYDLIFVAVHQKVLQLLYVDELLESVKSNFCNLLNPSGTPNPKTLDYSKFNGAAFTPAFKQLHDDVEAKHIAKKTEGKKMKTFAETEAGRKMAKEGKLKKSAAKKKKQPQAGANDQGEDDEEEEEDEPASPARVDNTPSVPSPAASPALLFPSSSELEEGEVLPSPAKTPSPAPVPQPRSPLEEGEIRDDEAEKQAREVADNVARMKAKKAAAAAGKSAAKPKAPAAKETTSGKKPKEGRKKEGPTKEELDALDISKAMGKPAAAGVISEEMRKQFIGEKPLNLNAPVDGAEDDEDEEEGAPKKGFFSSFISNWTNRTLERKDVDPILAKFREHLIAKNVASEIADKLCESLATSMAGTTMSSFKSINTALKAALRDSLTRILTPKKSVNILLDIDQLKKSKTPRPYTIVFVGVNGVGKSTSLAKVCYWLQQNGLKVMIAACDTFRSGAVEQLRTHCHCLGDTFLYEKGYGKDAAEVARDAISHGKDNRFDVVLIDTAGRMEGNEPLMRALAKLVNVNSPDLILFVGEALVGNKAVEQLTKFNQALVDMSGLETPRIIDGIFLTKFDTIDDKVGAALSMVYTTGQPIVFLGVGQHYHSVRAFSVDHVLPPLLKVL